MKDVRSLFSFRRAIDALRASALTSLAILSLLAFDVFFLSSCTWFDTDAQRGFGVKGKWDDPVLYTTADVRIITKRQHPVTGQWVVCTEPSPDVAKALSTASQMAAQGGTIKASGSVNISGSSSESALELAGRTTALLALRDGLYRTCEAYANGALGADAYALVLARYGQLMTTLFLAQDIATAAGAGPVGGAVTVSAPAPAALPPALPAPALNSGPATGSGAISSATAASSAAAASSSVVASSPPASSPPPATSSAAGSAPSTISSSIPAGAIAAATLGRMNEDYFDLDRNLLQLLVVSCINDNDPTRFKGRSAADGSAPAGENDAKFVGRNHWLRPLCNQLTKLSKIEEVTANQTELEQISGHPAKAIDITAAISLPVVATVNGAPGTAPPTSEQIRFAQTILLKDGYSVVGKADGVFGQNTETALRTYQGNVHLPQTGVLDPATMMALLNDAVKQLRGSSAHQ